MGGSKRTVFPTDICLITHAEQRENRKSGLGEPAAVPAPGAEEAYAGMMERMDSLEQKVMSTEMIGENGVEAGAFLPPLSVG